jgi:hypothetical protein
MIRRKRTPEGASLFFLSELLLDSKAVADQRKNVTDTELRAEIATITMRENAERRRVLAALELEGITPLILAHRSLEDEVRQKYDLLCSRLKELGEQRERASAVLYARLVLKDKEGLVPFLVRVRSIGSEDLAIERMQQQYPN